MYSLSDYDYKLPESSIAQKPEEQRDRSKLLVLNRKKNYLSHHEFSKLPDFLTPEDLLVVNNTEVIPGRLLGQKDTGGKVEVLILDYAGGKGILYQCLVKASKGPKPGSFLIFDQGLKARVISFDKGIYKLKFQCEDRFETVLYKIGNMPLPPYIKRGKEKKPCDDRKSYQTVYATQKGAIAAPTAGLHFTENLLEEISSRGVETVSVTLHVGYGTFLPVRVSDIREHEIHSEWYSISKKTADAINRAVLGKRRIVAVGTTSVRTLEYASDENGVVKPGEGYCDLFIFPGYKFKVVDSMITNFHLPQSTLLMLVSAFAGRETILNAYQEAISNKYRFYSYGDAMLIC
jgi:S-adenosylmethionine:tRNA ribosyltransferase-isomerase